MNVLPLFVFLVLENKENLCKLLGSQFLPSAWKPVQQLFQSCTVCEKTVLCESMKKTKVSPQNANYSKAMINVCHFTWEQAPVRRFTTRVVRPMEEEMFNEIKTNLGWN